MRPLKIIAGLAALAVAAILVRRAIAPMAVTTAAVRRADLTDTLSATGLVEGVQATVAPKLAGKVESLLVAEGDAITKGQVLARLDSAHQRAEVRAREAELRAAKEDVARVAALLDQERAVSRALIDRAEAAQAAARARLQELSAGSRPQEIESARQAVAAAAAEEDLARAHLERVRGLLAEGAVARVDMDQAQARFSSAQAALATARQQLSLAEQGARKEQIAAAQADLAAAEAGLRQARGAADQVLALARTLRVAEAARARAEAALDAARSLLAETEIIAPISGRIGRRYLHVGDLAGPAAPIFLLVGAEAPWIIAEVDEEDLALVHQGQRVQITAESLPQPLPGTVTEVGAVAIPRGLTQVRAKIVRCKVVLDHGHQSLKPDMDVDVTGPVVLAQNALLVPVAALSDSSKTGVVWVIDGGVARQRQVEVGRRTYHEAEITSGLREGELVVTSRLADLHDGRKVAARRGSSDGP